MFELPLDSERPFGKHRSMSRTHVRRRRWSVGIALGVTALLAGPVAGAVAQRAAGDLRPVAEQRYVVASGDTLWGIARQLAPNRDPRPVIDAIARENHLAAGHLSPGQSLTIPSIG
jgi:nucleoid-associated protein YgaU